MHTGDRINLPLGRTSLDRMGCGVPNCGHDHSILFLAPRCHPSGRVHVRYVKASGTIEIVCAKCRAPVITLAVAP